MTTRTPMRLPWTPARVQQICWAETAQRFPRATLLVMLVHKAFETCSARPTYVCGGSSSHRCCPNTPLELHLVRWRQQVRSLRLTTPMAEAMCLGSSCRICRNHWPRINRHRQEEYNCYAHNLLCHMKQSTPTAPRHPCPPTIPEQMPHTLVLGTLQGTRALLHCMTRPVCVRARHELLYLRPSPTQAVLCCQGQRHKILYQLCQQHLWHQSAYQVTQIRTNWLSFGCTRASAVIRTFI